MHEDYLGAMNEREPIMSEIAKELDTLHDEILASLDDEHLKQSLEE